MCIVSCTTFLIRSIEENVVVVQSCSAPFHFSVSVQVKSCYVLSTMVKDALLIAT